MYENNHIFLVVFASFVWLLWKYKNSSFLFLLTFALLILDLSPSNIRSESTEKAVLRNFAILTGKRMCWSAYRNLDYFLLLTYSHLHLLLE